MRALWGLLLGLMLMASAPGQQVTRDLVRSVLDAADCQSSLPGESESATGEDSSQDKNPARSGGRSLLGGLASLGSGFATILLWVFLAVVVVILAAAFVRHRRSVAPRQRSRAGPVQSVATHSAPEQSLPEYENLAAAGDFGGAVHAVLQHAFAICADCIGGLPEHVTGRQVLRLAKHKDLATDDLRELVTAVERVHFGGAVADRELYENSTQRLRAWEALCQER